MKKQTSSGRILAAAINLFIPDSEHKMYAYATYSDLCYKAAIGKTARQLRKDRQAKRSANALKLLSTEEIEKLDKVQQQVAGLLALRWEYEEIKALVMGEGK